MASFAAMGVGSAVGGVANYFGAKEQADAAKQGQELTAEQIANAQASAQQSAGSAMDRLNAQVPGALDNLESGYLGGTDYTTQGFGAQRADVLQSGALGADAVTQGQGGALSALYGSLGAGGDILANRQDRAGQMLDQPGGLYGNYQADPGYQFRLQQGEDAIRRMQAAQGGRFGGAAMKALEDYAQQSASQEFGNYVNRVNSDFGTRTSSDAQALQAGGQLANLYAQAGQGAANVYSGGGAQLADIYGRTGMQLGSNAAAAGASLGGAASNYYGQLASLPIDIAKQDNQYQMAAEGVSAGMVPTMAANNQAATPYAGSAANAIGNTANTLGQMAFFYGAQGPYGGTNDSVIRPVTYSDYADANDPNIVGPPITLSNQ